MITNAHLNSACTEVSAVFKTDAKIMLDLFFLSVQNFACFPCFILINFVKIGHTLLVTQKFKVETGTKHLKLLKCLTPICKKEDSYEHDVFR